MLAPTWSPGRSDLDQHRGDARTVEAAGHLVEVAREQLRR